MSERLDVRSVRSVIRRRWWLIALLVLAGAAAGYASRWVMPPVYRATVTLHVGQPLDTANLNKETLDASQQVALTYSDVIRREVVMQRVVDALELDTSWQGLSSRVGAAIGPQNRQLILVSVNAPSRNQARATAAEIGRQVIELSPTLEGQRTTETQDFVKSRLESLQGDIELMQARVDRLESALAEGTSGAEVDLQRRLKIERGRMVSSERNYSSLLHSLSTEAPTNVVQILETADVQESAVRPDLPANIALGAGLGLVLGFCLAYGLGFRREARMGLRTGPIAPAPHRSH